MNRLADIDSETRKAVSAFIERIARQYEMDGAILFGSRARKSHHAESDADVAVLLHGHSGEFVSTKLAMADVAYEVLLETGIRIRVIWGQHRNSFPMHRGRIDVTVLRPAFATTGPRTR